MSKNRMSKVDVVDMHDVVGTNDAVEESDEKDITITSKKHKLDEPLQHVPATSDQKKDYNNLTNEQLIAKLLEKDAVIEMKDAVIEMKDAVIEMKDTKIKTLESNENAKSLRAVIVGTSIQPLDRRGSAFSHTKPKNHDAAIMETKEFPLVRMREELEKLLSKAMIDLSTTRSNLLTTLSPDSKTVPIEASPEGIYGEADVAFFVNIALRDAVLICNALIEKAATNEETGVEVLKLFVRQEMTMFSNRCDHAVVRDSKSDAPLLCVETKKFFSEDFQDQVENKSLGQSFDQLKAMEALGHPNPLGALTSFNETYVTSLSSDVWEELPSFDNIKNIVSSAIPSTSTGTPPPLEVECADTVKKRRTQSEFVPDKNRKIYRSESCIDQNSLVSAMVVVILQALKGLYVPNKLEIYSKNDLIHRDCLQITSKGYKWGKLTTSFKGPACQSHFINDLYLLDYLGSGSTSRAYYAVTKEGWGCVVKMYVQSQHENGKLKSKEEFEYDSETHVHQEKENYTLIYGDELRDHVEVRVLNGLYCLVMPFFEPISVKERMKRPVLNDINKRLQQFAEKNMAFHECDQKWRHVGRFKENIYLFDLGDLVPCEKNSDAARICASQHLNRLKLKAEEIVGPNIEE